MTDPDAQPSDEADRQPVGDLHVEREKRDVLLRIEHKSGEEEEFYIPPEYAMQVAMWLQQAATDAKQWVRHEGVRTDGGTQETGGSQFPFEEGDDVLVRVRERGNTGNIVAKFEAECVDIKGGRGLGSPTARLLLPWGITTESTVLRPHDAEFEVIDDA